MENNEARKALYKFYRDLGYSPQEARKLRHRPLKAFDDYFAEKRNRRRQAIETGKRFPKPLSPPAKALGDTQIKSIRNFLHSSGINRKAAFNMTRSKEKAIHAYYSINRLLESMGRPERKAQKKALKAMLKRWDKAQSQGEVYAAIETNYLSLIGALDVKTQMEQLESSKAISIKKPKTKKPKKRGPGYRNSKR